MAEASPRASNPGVAPARAAAARVLLAVERGTAHADDQLRSPRVNALSQVDRDLTTELVLGTLRWGRVLDREIAERLRRPDDEMHLGVIAALRLGAYQLLFLDRIPPHAAVNESVELAKQFDGPAAGGLVNAILRRLLRERATLRALRSDPAAAYPEWLVARWRGRFGEEAAHRICAAGQRPPPFCARLQPGAERPEHALASVFLARAVRDAGDVPGLRLQDEASQLVGELAAFAAGEAILDTCAAPGGKTAILLERNPEAAITAMDASAARLRITERRFPWPPQVCFVPADAATLPAEPLYSTVLCDMPCSGTGTMARNPEIRHRLDEAEIARQAERQRAILTAAVGSLRPGGRLVYSTCSLEAEENEAVVEAVLAERPGVKLEPIAPLLDAMLARQVLTPEGHALLQASALAGPYLRTIPGVHPCDGFFAALLTVP